MVTLRGWLTLVGVLIALETRNGVLAWETSCSSCSNIALLKPENETAFFYQLYYFYAEKKVWISKVNSYNGLDISSVSFSTPHLTTTANLISSAVLTPDGDFLIFLSAAKPDDHESAVPHVFKVSGTSFEIKWENTYSSLLDGRITMFKKQPMPYLARSRTFVLGGLATQFGNATLLAVDVDTGKVAKSITIVLPGILRMFCSCGQTLGGFSTGEMVLYSASMCNEVARNMAMVYMLGPELEIVRSRMLDGIDIFRMYGLKQGELSFLLAIGLRGPDMRALIVKKLSADTLDVVWTRTFGNSMASEFELAQPSSPHHYVLFGGILIPPNEPGKLYGLNATDGTNLWTRSFIYISRQRLTHAVVLREGEFIITAEHNSQPTTFSYRLPRAYASMRCKGNDLDNCLTCPMGLFYNFTVCVPCSAGCRECVDPMVCTSCLDGFINSNGTRCLPSSKKKKRPVTCDCTTGSVSPQCIKNCSKPTCFAAAGSNVTIVPMISAGGNRTCECPRLLPSNGTHCFLPTSASCPALCSSCVRDGVFSYCTECVARPRVITHHTTRYFVDCRCEPGHLLNESACVRSVEARLQPENGSRKTGGAGVALCGVIAGVLAVACCIFVLRRRRGSMREEVASDCGRKAGEEEQKTESIGVAEDTEGK